MIATQALGSNLGIRPSPINVGGRTVLRFTLLGDSCQPGTTRVRCTTPDG